MKGFESPANVTTADVAFGGQMEKLLPPYAAIPDEFKRFRGNAWVDWQSDWFYSGLKCYPVPKVGIDVNAAMRHLAAIQGSYAPKHEHKSAGVAYLASLWFTMPQGERVSA